jgi:hypothetical protein
LPSTLYRGLTGFDHLSDARQPRDRPARSVVHRLRVGEAQRPRIGVTLHQVAPLHGGRAGHGARVVRGLRRGRADARHEYDHHRYHGEQREPRRDPASAAAAHQAAQTWSAHHPTPPHAFAALSTAGELGLTPAGSSCSTPPPLENPGSGYFGTPCARMRCANFSACVRCCTCWEALAVRLGLPRRRCSPHAPPCGCVPDPRSIGPRRSGPRRPC